VEKIFNIDTYSALAWGMKCKQYTVWFRFQTDISFDIRQNPVQVGFQKMPSGASLLCTNGRSVWLTVSYVLNAG